jgi:hypothetical protein
VVTPPSYHIYIDIDSDTEESGDDPYACLGYYGYDFGTVILYRILYLSFGV